MKTKISFIFIIIAFLALLSLGATQTGCNSKPTDTTLFNTTGLALSFIDNAPPSTINSGTTFPIYVKAENYGGYDINTGTAKFYLTGIGNNIKSVQTNLINQNQITKKTAEQEAGFEIIKFAEQAESSLALNNPFNFSMKADACYNYATHTEATACIGQGDSMCPLSGNKIRTGSNSNAPIQITNMSEQTQGNKLYISFLIENKGSGDVYYSDLDCDKLYGLDQSARTKEQLKKGFVEIYIDTGNEPDLKCNIQSSSGSTTESTNGMAPVGRKVTCSKMIGIQTNAAPLKINLAYKYINSISKQIILYP
jgi:hypothetical protein